MTNIARVVVRAVTKRFGSTLALRGISATLGPGLTRLVGANGSGKSTLLGVLGTVVRPTTGEVCYEPFGAAAAEVRAQIGWVSHESMLYGDLSAIQNLELAAKSQGLSSQASVERVRERFRLGSFEARPVRTLSRGQRQRVALARALVHAPSLLLLDEPSTGLDREGIERLRQVVSEELERGIVAVVVEHEPAMFRDLATAEVRLERGRVV